MHLNKLVHLKVLKLHSPHPYSRSHSEKFNQVRAFLQYALKKVETITLLGDWELMINEEIREQFHVITFYGIEDTIKLLRKLS